MPEPWQARRQTARAAHVWVDVTGQWTEASRVPGLLTEMRQVDGRWSGYVIVARLHYGGGVVRTTVEQGWYLAEHIRPVSPTDPATSPR